MGGPREEAGEAKVNTETFVDSRRQMEKGVEMQMVTLYVNSAIIGKLNER